MARRSASTLLAAALCLVALMALANVAFVPAAQSQKSAAALRGSEPHFDQAAQAAVLGAVLTAPQAAHAASQGYALLQLGWAVFIISLGPAVLFWIYFNKPELL
eukprot:TRINITY_DN22735_c5_g1_i1.p1 TRINITY_DN22735_c5_g1~~TRINITY_DN22735_c5_g1_i1.p1  ORF type:complete len:104 (-),score=30.79 TRINITY_DN22735_c5_g1_i1:181-492(-)